MIKVLNFIILLFIITSCETYNYIPPESFEGRTCVNRCQSSRDYCLSNCDRSYNDCIRYESIESQRAYDNYLKDRIFRGLPVERSAESFRNFSNCNKFSCESRCNGAYNSCFVNCGGIIERVQN